MEDRHCQGTYNYKHLVTELAKVIKIFDFCLVDFLMSRL